MTGFKFRVNEYGFEVWAKGNKVTLAKDLILSGLGGQERIPAGVRLEVAGCFRPSPNQVHCIHPRRPAVSFWLNPSQIEETLPEFRAERVTG